MDIKINGHEYFYDITSISMLFFPGEKTNFVKRSNSPVRIISSLTKKSSGFLSKTSINYYGKIITTQKTAAHDCDTKNLVKYTFYIACSRATGITSPWGILTGIRPLSVYMRHLKRGDDVRNILKNEYLVSDSKINILESVFRAEQDIFISREKDVSIYISIPFCPSKCTYCSFVSVASACTNDLLEKYVSLLCDEIRIKSDVVNRFGLTVRSVYFGGGTPGILSHQELERVLETVRKNFDLSMCNEICFEMGRPETVDENKLEILKKFGVTRICINTQTTNDEVLSSLNRSHTSSEYFSAIDCAKKFCFESINTDIIAGLPGEDINSFIKTLKDVISKDLNNITVHTLAIKRASKLREDKNNYKPVNPNVVKMLSFSYKELTGNGYIPYYIYRQKNCVSNGENIGYCRPGQVCKYNVYMMEDVHSVIACGAGASSKLISGSRVERVINVKYPMEYVKDFDKIKANTEKISRILKETKNHD